MGSSSCGGIVVVVPCYEPSASVFLPYVKELLNKKIKRLIVVDDGSGSEYAGVFASLSALENVTVISYEKNQGKGYALKCAFSYCKQTFTEEDVFVTADCDGQHLVCDVLKVAQYAKKNPSCFVLGSRDFSSGNKKIPGKSRFGNRFSSCLFSFLYGVKNCDTQTGLRGFSYLFLEKLIAVTGKRFEYETNVLTCFARSKVKFLKTKINTVYEKKPKDVKKRTHFKPFKDSMVITFCLLKNAGLYAFSGIVSFLIDNLVFYLLHRFIFVGLSSMWREFFSTVLSRVVSSVFNFGMNFGVVFKGKSFVSILKYYALWSVQLGLTYLFTSLWSLLPVGSLALTLLKATTDAITAIFSYFVQSRWVFKSKEKE